jgi:hypothetical protein
VDVPVDTSEWRTVASRFHSSLKESSYHIIRIERIQVSGCPLEARRVAHAIDTLWG